MPVDHPVVDVVAERVGECEQQPVRGGERRGEPAGRHQPRDHIRQSRDLRGGEHDHVRMDAELVELEDAVVVEVVHADPGDAVGRHQLPALQPARQFRDRLADHVLIDLQLGEGRIGRRGEVQQEDEEQRPRHRVPRLAHARRGEVAHQDVRQRGGAHHQAEDQREEVDRAVQVELLVWSGEGLGVRQHHLAGRPHGLLERLDALERHTIHQLRDRHAGDLHRHQDHRDQVGDDQHDVLRDLRPGDRAHAAHHRADQDAGEPDEHRDRERDVEEALGDDADADDLRDDIDERGGDQHDHADEARDVAAVARAEEVRHRVLAELAQIGREQDRHQHVAAGPAEHEGKPAIAERIEAACHADERSGRHPVRARRHAVVDRGHAPSGDVVLAHLHGAAEDADIGIHADREGDEQVADHAIGHAQLFEAGEDQHEEGEAADIAGVDLVQLF